MINKLVFYNSAFCAGLFWVNELAERVVNAFKTVGDNSKL
jgi:hypothetical protein